MSGYPASAEGTRRFAQRAPVWSPHHSLGFGSYRIDAHTPEHARRRRRRDRRQHLAGARQPQQDDRPALAQVKIGGQYHHRQFLTNTSNPMNGDAIFLGGVTGSPMGDALLGYPGEIRRGEGNTLTDGIGRFIMGHRKRVSRFSFRGQVVLK